MRLPHVLIERRTLQKLSVCALRSDPSFIEYDDGIGIDHGGKPVCNHNDGFILYEIIDGLLNNCLIFRVGVGSRLIKHDNGAIFEQRTGNGEPLALAA